MSFRITYSVVDADMGELNREFDAAVTKLREDAGATFPSWIGGEPVESGTFLESRSPFDTHTLLARFHTATEQDVDRAITTAKKAQVEWARTPWKERARLINAAADLISERRMKLAAVATFEVGKNRMESLGDVEEAADLFRYYAQQLTDSNGMSQPLGKLSPNEDTRDVLRPYGVFAVIAPFNFPVALSAGMSGAAMLAGNTVILKPAEATPWCAQLLYECVRDAGVPPGVFQVLHGSGETVGKALSNHPKLDGIAFTGSSEVGMELFRIMSTGRIRPCLMEMGGKNGTIVTESADLDDAVEGCARSAFGLSGQKCSALSRIYVHRSKYDAFVEKLGTRAKSIVVGDPSRNEVFMGPVIDTEAVKRFEDAVAEAKAAGTVVAGGERLTGGAFDHGTFVAPTVVAIPAKHPLNRRELFLPFVTVAPFDTLDEAFELLNDADHGLTAGIFSAQDADVEAFMDRAEAGILYANRKTGATTGAWPGVQSFCGWKASGSTGKGGCGPYYLSQFAREQSQTRMIAS